MDGTTGGKSLSGRYLKTGKQGQNLVLVDMITTNTGCPGEPPFGQRLADVRHVSMHHEDGQQQVLELHQDTWMVVAALEPVA